MRRLDVTDSSWKREDLHRLGLPSAHATRSIATTLERLDAIIGQESQPPRKPQRQLLRVAASGGRQQGFPQSGGKSRPRNMADALVLGAEEGKGAAGTSGGGIAEDGANRTSVRGRAVAGRRARRGTSTGQTTTDQPRLRLRLDPERPCVRRRFRRKPLDAQLQNSRARFRGAERRSPDRNAVRGRDATRSREPSSFTWELGYTIRATIRMYAFSRAFILGNVPEVSLLRFEGDPRRIAEVHRCGQTT